MNSSASDKAKGTAKEASGSIKQAVGKAVGND
ncbi:MAG: CsbD family protein, partial [Acidobacteriota bacterium]|nr:CsbD family protein [Acidobacteriota bacterium]